MSKIESLVWHHISEYDPDFYRIEYILDGFWHKIQLTGWNVDGDIPTFVSKSLRATLACVPEERTYR